MLETERLILRPWEETDAESLYKYASDLRIGPISGWAAHRSVEESQEVIRTILSAPGVFAMVLRETGEVVGSIGLAIGTASNLVLPAQEAEVGFWIGVPFWGRGLTPEAVEEILRYGFDTLGLTTIWCGYFDGNEQSKRVGEKCGFVHVRSEERYWAPIDKTVLQHITKKVRG